MRDDEQIYPYKDPQGHHNRVLRWHSHTTQASAPYPEGTLPDAVVVWQVFLCHERAIPVERHEVEVPTRDPLRDEPGRELMGSFVEFGNTLAVAAVRVGACVCARGVLG
jgi:hypothetical protein